MTKHRSYGEGCAIAHAADVVGERWALLVVRELLYGPKRFTDLRACLPGMSSSVLTQRLLELVESGVAVRYRVPPPAASWVYELTEWGRDLKSIVIALGRWGQRSPTFARDAPVTPCSMALLIEEFFDSANAPRLTGEIGIALGDEHFHASVRAGSLKLSGAGAGCKVATSAISSRPDDLRRFLTNGSKVTLPNLKRNGVQVSGEAGPALSLLKAIAL